MPEEVMKNVYMPNISAPYGYMFKSNSIDRKSTTPLARQTVGAYIDMVGPDARRIAPFAVKFQDMYLVTDMCPEYSTGRYAMGLESIRNGYEWKPRFTAYCPDCAIEYKDKHNIGKCPKCGSDLLYADPHEYVEVDRWLRNINAKHQNILDINQMLTYDALTVDELWIIVRWKYIYDKEGVYKHKIPREVYRASPILMREDIDEKGRFVVRYWRCREHSQSEDVVFAPVLPGVNYVSGLETHGKAKKVEWKGEAPHCGRCQKPMLPVRYISTTVEGNVPEEFYLEDEVIHTHHFGKGAVWGDPPSLKVWAQTTFLIHQSIWLRDYYMKRRVPGGVMIFQSANPAQDMLNWDKVTKRIRTEDQHHYPAFFMETDFSGTSGKVDFVKFMEGLKDMEYSGTRNEARRTIGDVLGCKIYISGMESTKRTMAKDKLNEIEVMTTQRAIISLQHTLDWINNELMRRCGVRNWEILLRSPEPSDESAFLDTKLKRVEYANQMQMLGYRAVMTETGEFEFRPKPLWEDSVVQVLQRVLSQDNEPQEMGMEGGAPGQVGQGQDQATGNHPAPTNKKGQGGPVEKALGDVPIELMLEYKIWGVYDKTTNDLVDAFDTKEEATLFSSFERPGDSSYYVDFIFKGVTTQKPKTSGVNRMGRSSKVSAAVQKNPPSRMSSGRYKCPLCGRQFASKQALGGHQIKSHGGPRMDKNSGAPAGEEGTGAGSPAGGGGPGGMGGLPKWAQNITASEAIELLEELSE